MQFLGPILAVLSIFGGISLRPSTPTRPMARRRADPDLWLLPDRPLAAGPDDIRGHDSFHLSWVINLVVWGAVFVAGAAWRFRRDTAGCDTGRHADAAPGPAPRPGARTGSLTSNLVGLTIAGVWLVSSSNPSRPRGRTVERRAATSVWSRRSLSPLSSPASSAPGVGVPRTGGDPRPQAGPMGRYALLVALAALATVTIGQPGTTTWVFVAVAGLWTMPVWAAVGAGVGLIAAYETLVRVVPDWSRNTGCRCRSPWR